MDHAWTCRCCGKQFNTLLLDIAYHAPDHWVAIPEAERQGKIDQEVCFLHHDDDGIDIFLRGVIEIPIVGLDENFRWAPGWPSPRKVSGARSICGQPKSSKTSRRWAASCSRGH